MTIAPKFILKSWLRDVLEDVAMRNNVDMCLEATHMKHEEENLKNFLSKVWRSKNKKIHKKGNLYCYMDSTLRMWLAFSFVMVNEYHAKNALCVHEG